MQSTGGFLPVWLDGCAMHGGGGREMTANVRKQQMGENCQWLMVNCQLSMRRGASLTIDQWQMAIGNFGEMLVI